MQTIKFLPLWLIGGGILAFVVGVLLDGPSGDPVGIYFGGSGLVLIAIGIVTFAVWLVISKLRRDR